MVFDGADSATSALDARSEISTGDGRKFAGLAEYRALLLADPRAISQNLANQLVLYATGAPIGFADRAVVEQMLVKLGKDPSVRSLIDEVVQSPLFLIK